MILNLSPEFRLELTGESKCAARTEYAGGIGIVTLEFDAPPEPFAVEWRIPQHDIEFRWTSASGKIGEGYQQFLPPSWHSRQEAEPSRHAPVFALVGAAGVNRLTAAVSDCRHRVGFRAGIGEEGFNAECAFLFDELPAEPYWVQLRFDLREVPFPEAVAAVAAWWEAMSELPPLETPPGALEPVYSTWYGHHRAVSDEAVEREVVSALEYGMKTVIVDDGWQQTGSQGGYAFAGEWRPDMRRFPQMERHVARVRASGMRYLLWIALPFVGGESRIFPEMRSKLLYFSPGLNTWILDPRFPEVREHLIGVCLRLLAEYRLDGLKIDFLDRFPLPPGTPDPAVADGFVGRDCRTVAEGVHRLLAGLGGQLRRLPHLPLIEFRQDYIGPEMRHAANIFRVTDCPGDRIANRRRIVQLRLLSGGTAVHSDMLGWHPEEPVESAILQLWNVVFAVPQISVSLGELSAAHRRMLRFFLGFWEEHRHVFLHGTFRPEGAGGNYPQISAVSGEECAVAVYDPCRLVCPDAVPKSLLINATPARELAVGCQGETRQAEVFDCMGEAVGVFPVRPGLSRLPVPPGGVAIIGK